jgi:hypothetical protein
MMPEKAIAPKSRPGVVRRIVRWMFLNRRTGAMTVIQWPNISLSVYIGLSVAQRLSHALGTNASVLKALADVALIVWGVDELIRGVNPFRRILGSVVLLATIASLTVLAG